MDEGCLVATTMLMMRVIIRKHEDGGDGDYDACGYDQEDTDENAEDMKPAAPTKYAYIYIYIIANIS